MYTQTHHFQEIAQARHADYLNEASQERLAAIAREGKPAARTRLRGVGVGWATAAVRRVAGRGRPPVTRPV